MLDLYAAEDDVCLVENYPSQCQGGIVKKIVAGHDFARPTLE